MTARDVEATQARIHLSQEDGHLTFEIADDVGRVPVSG
jgi:hypothetical protein